MKAKDKNFDYKIYGTPEQEKALADARKMFDDAIAAGVPFVRIVASHHEYSHGYWVEFEPKKLASGYDFVVTQYTKIQEHGHVQP